MAERPDTNDVVEGFGKEWSRFDQRALQDEERDGYFQAYFRLFPWNEIGRDAVGADIGCGTGRWAELVARNVGTLHCVDASERALEVARRNLRESRNCEFHLATIAELPLDDVALDFAYCLGVLHHVSDPLAALQRCVERLKPGAPFLVYVYYALENRPWWYRGLWRITDVGRRVVSALPFRARAFVCDLIAATIYWPLARCAGGAERRGFDVRAWPLAFYRKSSFYTMRTDALDRFGTRIELRFTASELKNLMEQSGLEQVQISDSAPYWCAIGRKRA